MSFESIRTKAKRLFNLFNCKRRINSGTVVV